MDKVFNSTCRFCEGELRQPALLSYSGSPQSAQGFLDSLDQIDDVVDLKIFQCSFCGLVQHCLPPVSYFRDVIRAVAYSKEMANFREEQLSKWILNNKLFNKNIIEIGSGRGEYLELLIRCGAKQLSGLENSIESVDFAQSKGLDVRRGYLSPGFSTPWSNLFDAFTIFSFMEHWPDLRGSLFELRKLLNEGAVGLIEVPNFDFVLSNGLYSEFTPDHIFYFDKNNLRTVIELCGFEVIEISSVWHNYILSAQVKKRVALSIDGFTQKQVRIVNELNTFLEKFKREEVVVWGAGHQALAVMSVSKITNKISHVVDSATFKQQKYTPGTKLLIKNPASLLKDKPIAIVVMAAAYSDEVYSTIKTNYPSIKHIALLREDHLEISAFG